MNSARDNFFKSCPAVMDYSSFTDYRNSYRREQYVKSINNITSDYDYKDFLQTNARKIANAEWSYLQSAFGCKANACIHTSPTSPPSGDFNAELKRYNAVKMSGDLSKAPCKQYDDYRLTMN